MHPNDSHAGESVHASVVREAIARSLAVVGLGGIALIHLLDAHDTFISTPYKGWLYVGLIVGSLLTAGALARRNDRRAWLAAFLLPLGSFIAFIYSRTLGLPGGADDIGDWWEPLGLASLFVEASVLSLAGMALLQFADFAVRMPARSVRLERSTR